MWKVTGRHGEHAEKAGSFILSGLVLACGRQKGSKTIIVSKVELFKKRQKKKKGNEDVGILLSKQMS